MSALYVCAGQDDLFFLLSLSLSLFLSLLTVLGSSWALLGFSWGPLGASWGLLGFSWGALGTILGPSTGHLGAIWKPLGGFSSISDPLETIFGHYTRHVRKCTKTNGKSRFWAPRRAVWAPLGAILGPSWATLGPLGPSWGHLGPSWGHLGSSWGVLGPSWKPSWRCSGLFRGRWTPKNLDFP